MSSSISRKEPYVGVALDAFQRHRSVADYGVILGQHQQSLHLQVPDLLVSDCVLIEYFFG